MRGLYELKNMIVGLSTEIGSTTIGVGIRKIRTFEKGRANCAPAFFASWANAQIIMAGGK